jgi:hypothetical protein
LQQLPREDWRRAYGQDMLQRDFERGLQREYNGVRHFRDLVVYPDRIQLPGGVSKPIYIVAGLYFDGRPRVKDGKEQAEWRPRCFVTEVPYKALGPTTQPAAAAFTVVDYLKSLKGVGFQYAWWRDPRWGLGIWTAASVVLIGGIWPTLVNLMVYGSIWRPRQSKGIDLSRVKPTTAEAAPQPSITEKDLAETERLGAQLEVQLAASPSDPVSSTNVQNQPTKIRDLSAAPLVGAAPETEKDQKDFGQDEDDFYPTELKTHTEKHE